MPKFLEEKLRREYGNNNRAIYGTMNAIGAMHGNKITAKGRKMEQKHEADMKKATPTHHMQEMRIEIHRAKGKVTGATVHHSMAPRNASKSGAFIEHEHVSHPFSHKDHKAMISHVNEHLAGAFGGEEENE